MDSDRFVTILTPGTSIIRERGSKFIALADHTRDEGHFEDLLRDLKQSHPRSSHICYAYRLDLGGEKFRMNDDGEPPGSAGRPIYDVIRSFDLFETTIWVVRYFGGTKLGIPGLIGAYGRAAREAVINAKVGIRYLTSSLRITFEPQKMGLVYKYLKQLDVDSIENAFPDLIVSVRQSQVEQVRRDLTALYHGIQPDEWDGHGDSGKIKIIAVQ